MTRKRVLLWLEPRPFRNSFIQYAKHHRLVVSQFFTPGMASLAEIKVFSNRATLEFVRDSIGVSEDRLIWPNAHEQRAFEADLAPWSQEGVRSWTRYLTDSDGHEHYLDVLYRLHSDFDFDLLFSFTETSVLKEFSKSNGVGTFFMELGPTREPFEKTFYADPSGLNGNAWVRGVDSENFGHPDGASEISAFVRLSQSFEHVGIDSALAKAQNEAALLRKKLGNYVLVPLQVPDDSNLLVHGRGWTLRSFAEHSIEEIQSQGLVPLLKPHPGSAARAFNFLRQRELLASLSSLRGVVSTDELGQAPSNLALLVGADGMKTLNSSMGFEFGLIGGTPTVLGAALYTQDNLEGPRQNVDKGLWRNRVNFLLRHFLHPYRAGDIESLISRLIAGEHGAFAKRKGDHRSAFGQEELSINQTNSGVFFRLPTSQDGIRADSKCPRSYRSFFLIKDGAIESLSVERKAGGKLLVSVTGWAIIGEGGRGPSSVAFFSRSGVSSGKSRLIDRLDTPGCSATGFQASILLNVPSLNRAKLVLNGATGLPIAIKLKVGRLQNPGVKRFFSLLKWVRLSARRGKV